MNVDWKAREIRRFTRRRLPREIAEALERYRSGEGCGCCEASNEVRKQNLNNLIKVIRTACAGGGKS